MEARAGGPAGAADALHLLEQLPVELTPVDQPLVKAAAEIKREHPVSYADAFCVATAARVRGTILTSDPAFRSVEHVVNVRWRTT